MSGEVREGAEPFSVDNGAAGAVILHGFIGSPLSLRPLAESIAAAGWSVELPRLPGHGTQVDDLLAMSYADFFVAADEAYARLARRGGPVVAVGLSMGGTLSLSLALAHEELAGLVLINPMVAPPAPSFLELLRGALQSGAKTIPSIGSDIARLGAVSGGYNATPIAPMLSLMKATGSVAPQLSSIKCPALLLSSRVDHVVPLESSDLLEREFGGPIERVVLENSYHVATLDHDAAEIEKRSVEFLEQLRG